MADGRYRTSLTGLQVDDALRQLNERVAEGWAEGTRDGNEVGSDSPYYHNNAKYYAELAKSATPTPYTAAVRWDADMNLADSDKARARANISAGASNRNLLDNPWFTVNQRGFTSVNYTTTTTPAYCVDRWLFGGQGALTYNSDKSLTVTINAAVWGGLTQRFDPIYKGLNVTFSIMLTNGTVVSGNGVIPSASGTNIYNITLNGSPWQVLLRSDGSTWWMELRCSTAGATATIRAVKLELGSYSTLANDVPPDYGEELLKCQRYFYRMDGSAASYTSYGFCVAVNATTAELFVNTPVVMRTTPTVSYSGTFQLRDYTGGNTRAISAMGVDTRAATTLKVAITASSLTLGWVMQLRGAASATYIDFSADL